MAPLLFCALAITAKASAEASVAMWLASLIVLWATLACLRRAQTPLLTPFGIAVLAYAAWLAGTNLWINPYNSAASYDAAFLVTGYLLGRGADKQESDRLLAVALTFVAALAAWSLWQRVAGTEMRGRAVFETPATFASTINLVLVPGLVFVAAGRRNLWLLAALALLAGALLGAASRGGWLALAAAGFAALALLRRAQVRVPRDSILIIAAIFAAGYGLILLEPLSTQTAFGTAVASGTSRLELYKAAVNALANASWLTGSGYVDFRYVLEAARPTIPSYRDGLTYFVHDDYLQVLLELGVPGLVLLLLIVGVPLVQTWTNLPHIAPERRPFVIALAAAMMSMAVHALVDFPFYIALCLVIYGACGGLLAAALWTGPLAGAEMPPLARAGRAALVTACAWLLVKPVAAEAAAERARTQWRLGNSEVAAHWFEVARRVESSDWRFHWYAGQFWFVQANAGGSANAARLADRAFEAGIRANPHEVSNLVWRISTHVYLRQHLEHPADIATLHTWLAQASTLAPLDARVTAHREAVARFAAQASR